MILPNAVYFKDLIYQNLVFWVVGFFSTQLSQLGEISNLYDFFKAFNTALHEKLHRMLHKAKTHRKKTW